jgi:hypothetical protein
MIRSHTRALPLSHKDQTLPSVRFATVLQNSPHLRKLPRMRRCDGRMMAPRKPRLVKAVRYWASRVEGWNMAWRVWMIWRR